MSRRHAAEKREVLPDAKYGDKVVTKFMNNLMTDGKKSVAETIVYNAFERVQTKVRREPVEVFHEALDNIKLPCGDYIAYWDGKVRGTGREAAPGIYIYELVVDGERSAKKMYIAK